MTKILIRLKKIITETTIDIKHDSPGPWDIFFQDNATPQMEGLEELHNNIMFYLAIIMFAVSWMMILIIINFKKIETSMDLRYSIELILTICLVLMLVLVTIPFFILLFLLDEGFDPALYLGGEDYQSYPGYLDSSEDKNIENPNEYILYMNVDSLLSINTDRPWNDIIPHMTQFSQEMAFYKGQTLKEAGLSLDPSAAKTRSNICAQYFKHLDPGAFLYFGPDDTIISDQFLQRADTLSYKFNFTTIPKEFLETRGVKDLKKIPWKIN